MSLFPAFGVKAEAEHVTGLNSILAGLRSFYIERGATIEARNKTV
jgi:hypothetical protein